MIQLSAKAVGRLRYEQDTRAVRGSEPGEGEDRPELATTRPDSWAESGANGLPVGCPLIAASLVAARADRGLLTPQCRPSPDHSLRLASHPSPHDRTTTAWHSLVVLGTCYPSLSPVYEQNGQSDRKSPCGESLVSSYFPAGSKRCSAAGGSVVASLDFPHTGIRREGRSAYCRVSPLSGQCDPRAQPAVPRLQSRDDEE